MKSLVLTLAVLSCTSFAAFAAEPKSTEEVVAAEEVIAVDGQEKKEPAAN